MKKRLYILSCVAMLAVGLALYANNTSTVKSLTESTVEALSQDGDNGSGNNANNVDYANEKFGTAPYVVFNDAVSHILIIGNAENKTNAKGKPINNCNFKVGGTCRMNTNSTCSYIAEIKDLICDVLRAAGGLAQALSSSIAQYLISKFK
jgi:hypothetical protein